MAERIQCVSYSRRTFNCHIFSVQNWPSTVTLSCKRLHCLPNNLCGLIALIKGFDRLAQMLQCCNAHVHSAWQRL
jgi:hypothetical protein